MRWIVSVAVVMGCCAVSAPSHAEMDDENRGKYIKKAWYCGQIFQGIRTLQNELEFPDFKLRFLEYASSERPDDWELELISLAFERGMLSAMKDGIYPGVDEVLEEDKRIGLESASKVVHACLGDNWRDYKK